MSIPVPFDAKVYRDFEQGEVVADAPPLGWKHPKLFLADITSAILECHLT